MSSDVFEMRGWVFAVDGFAAGVAFSLGSWPINKLQQMTAPRVVTASHPLRTRSNRGHDFDPYNE